MDGFVPAPRKAFPHTRMRSAGRNSTGGFCFFLLLIPLYFCFLATEAFGLSPADLIIVFNLNMPESKGIASYFAKKRRVPISNLVAVDVPTSERILRSDFEKRLAHPVLAAVERLRADGIDPAVLLVYGIPLCVKDPADMKPYEPFMALVEGKAKEYKNLVLQMIRELDHLIDENESRATQPEGLMEICSPEDVLRMARESLHRGLEYLGKPPASKDRKMKLLTVSSLLIRLAGTSLAARSFVASMSEEEEKGRAGEGLGFGTKALNP